MLKTLDLFSGIGGFSLGLERTGGFKTVAFCEIDPYCRKVLAKHWPDVPCFEDITKLKGEDVGPVDVVCGGFPCQPFSSASRGRRNARADDRWLWPEMFRLISYTRPAWTVCENSDEIDGLALEQVQSNLESIGYESRPIEIPACSVGLDHIRTRCWILGHANGNSKPSMPFNEKMARMSRRGSFSSELGEAYGIPSRMDRLRALGNAVVPQIPELIGHAILQSMGDR